jgi:hypothetical protein
MVELGLAHVMYEYREREAAADLRRRQLVKAAREGNVPVPKRAATTPSPRRWASLLRATER